jgi:hypothetical protein
MRLAGRFSRRIRGYAEAHDIPVIDCPAGQRKHDLAEEYLAKTTVIQGLFLVLVGRASSLMKCSSISPASRVGWITPASAGTVIVSNACQKPATPALAR